MTRQMLSGIGVGALLLLGGCGDKDKAPGGSGGAPTAPGDGAGTPAPVAPDSVEGLFEAVGAQFDNLVRALRGAKESNSPEKFSEIVGLVTTEMRAIAARLQNLEVPSDEVKQGFSERMAAREEEMQKTFGNLEIYLEGLAPEARTGVEATLRDFYASMGEVQPVFAKYFAVESAEEAPIEPPEPPGLPE